MKPVYDSIEQALKAQHCADAQELARRGYQMCGDGIKGSSSVTGCHRVFLESGLHFDAWPPLCDECWHDAMSTVMRGKRQ